MAKENLSNTNNIGTMIRALCAEHNITVVELERKCNLGNGSIKRWENGSSPSLKAVSQIADYFDVSIDYLAGRTPQRDKFEEWNKKYNVKRLAEEAKLFDTLGSIKKVFSDVELISLTDNDIALLRAYVELLKKTKSN